MKETHVASSSSLRTADLGLSLVILARWNLMGKCGKEETEVGLGFPVGSESWIGDSLQPLLPLFVTLEAGS